MSRQEARARVKGRRARCFGHGVPPTRSAPEAPAVSPPREAWLNGHRGPQGRTRSHPGERTGGRSHLRGQARSRNYPGRRRHGRRHLLVLELGRDLLIPACGRRHRPARTRRRTGSRGPTRHLSPAARGPCCPGAGQWADRRRTGQIRDRARASQPCRHLRSHQVRHPALVRRPPRHLGPVRRPPRHLGPVRRLPRHLGPVRRRTRRAEARQVRRAARRRRRPRRGARFGAGLRPPPLGPTRRLP